MSEEEIRPISVNVAKKTITLGNETYGLIMCYLCPFDGVPVYAQWKLNGKPAAPDNTIGRALRDSGFGAHRIFETEDGQGFEYDFEKDPRKKHSHEERPSYYGGRLGVATMSWLPFLTLNPIFNVNSFFNYSLKDSETGSNTLIKDDAGALEVIGKMKKSENFKVLNDICGHGRPLFYLNNVAWEKNFSHMWGSRGKKAMEVLEKWLDIDLSASQENPPERYARPKQNPSIQYADTPSHYTDPAPQLLISRIKHIQPSNRRNIFARARLLRQLQDLTGMWSLKVDDILAGQYDLIPRENPAPVEKVSKFPTGDRGPTLIIGGPGSGKSLHGWGLVEKEHKKSPEKQVVAVKFPQSKRHLLPKWVTIFVDTIEQVPRKSIAVIDEAEDVCSKWDHTKGSPLAYTLRLARQNRITLFFINQDTFIDKGAAMKIRNLIIKEVGPLQAGLERSGVGKFIRAATDALRQLPEDKVKNYAYIITSRGEGLIPTTKPSFWSEKLSEAYATDPDEYQAMPMEMVPMENPGINEAMHSIMYGCPGKDCSFGLCKGQTPPVTPYEHIWKRNHPIIRSEHDQTLIVGEVMVKDFGLKGINDAPRIEDAPHESDGKARHVPMYLYTIGNLLQIKLEGGQILPFTDKYLVTGKDARYLFIVPPNIARLDYITPDDLPKAVKHGQHVVMFGSAWCPHSQKMRERLADISKSHPDITFSVVDADAAPALSKRLGLQDTPSTLFYSEGALVGSVKGNRPIDEKLEEVFSISTTDKGVACPA